MKKGPAGPLFSAGGHPEGGIMGQHWTSLSFFPAVYRARGPSPRRDPSWLLSQPRMRRSRGAS